MKYKLLILLILVTASCALAQQIRVVPGTKVTIASDTKLDIFDGDLILESDATGDASLLNRGTISYTGGGQASVERYISAWNGNSHGWHLLSSPLASQNIQPSFVSNPPTLSEDFYSWDEVTGLWINSKLENGAWNPAMGSSFIPGCGYLVAYSESLTKTFEGTLNSADVTKTGLNYTLTSPSPGWHLLGNPFPCALQWNLTTGSSGWNLSNIDGISKTWNETNASYCDIGTGDIIPAMQGFMVHISSEETGSLTIPASDRTHSTTAWYKSDPVNKIKLTAYDTKGNTAQECMVQFNSEATKGFDAMYDSRFLKGYAPQFFALTEDAELSTNTLPGFEEDLVVPLGFVKNTSEEFMIKVEGCSSLVPEQSVYLKDVKLNLTQELNKKPQYYFTADEGDSPLRFKLLFGKEEEESSADNIQVFQANGHLEVQFGRAVDADLQVYNITGQLVSRKAVNQQSSCTINMHSATGAFVVTVNTPEFFVSKKLILF